MAIKTNSILLMLIFLFMSSTVYACNKGGHYGKHLNFLAEKLNLTQEQQARLKAAHETHKTDRKAVHGQHKAIMDKLFALNPSDADFQQQVDALAQQKAQLAADKAKKRIFFKAKLLQVLTPEQRAAFVTLHANKKRGHQGHGHHGRGHQCQHGGGHGKWCPKHRGHHDKQGQHDKQGHQRHHGHHGQEQAK